MYCTFIYLFFFPTVFLFVSLVVFFITSIAFPLLLYVHSLINYLI